MRQTRILSFVFGLLGPLAGSGSAQSPVFVSSESAHLIVHYVKGTAAQRDLARIIADREKAYQQITGLLKVAPEKKIAVFLYPTRESSQSGHGTGHALNDGAGVSVNYFDFSPSFERSHYGHELTHAIAFHLAGRHQDLPILSEGLAEFLDQSGRDMHDVAAACVRIRGQRTALRVDPGTDLDYSDWPGQCGYEKAGSFVRFLVEAYGWERFLALYKATAQTEHGFPGDRLVEFERLIDAAYATPLETLERGWNAALSPHYRKTLPRLAAEDEAAVRELFAKQDQAAAVHDARHRGLLRRAGQGEDPAIPGQSQVLHRSPPAHGHLPDL
jgi:hypothetical protein